jgi:aldose 1-epimerase|tara:strand:- start:4002 stop:5165 length:1164 start_codon:yes stop_codon:yes gene_type:complete
MKSWVLLSLLLFFLLVFTSCKDSDTSKTEPNKFSVEKQSFGTTIDGQNVKLFTLRNEFGMEANISEYGAVLVSLYVPDRDGNAGDVTVGFDDTDFDSWEGNASYFGATVGRYGNRIGDGRFTLDGKEYELAKNNEPGIPCHLHGGVKGFDKVVWEGESVKKEGATGIKLTYLSKDGEEGYPGNLSVAVTYWLTDSNELIWEAEATTDQATPVNLVHHSYWNLSADHETTIYDHELQILADHFLPTDKGLIPTGEKAPVAGTPMDFRELTAIGVGVEADFEPLKIAGGYDHCWVLREGEGIRPAAKVTDPKTGRTMEILTDQAGVQFYGGNFIDGTSKGKNGTVNPHRGALCLETECFPDSPNKPDFPNGILRPGETYKHTLIHRFSW